MPVCSYIVHPRPGTLAGLTERLNREPGCEAIPSDNRELLILVTDTVGPEEEAALQEVLKTIPDIAGLSQTFGQVETDSNKERTS